MSGLPSGTVTFLFTDIEGSTRLLRRLGEVYAEVLRRHDRLVRAACADHGGREVSAMLAVRSCEEGLNRTGTGTDAGPVFTG